MSNEHLDRAIVVAEDATEGMPYLGNRSNHDRAYARALIAELLRDMPTFFANPPAKTTEAVCNEIRRRAGIVEGEG